MYWLRHLNHSYSHRFKKEWQKEVLVNSFIYSNFDYCPLLAWMLSHKKSLDKIESLQKRALRFLLNDYDVSSYKQLLEKSGKCNMIMNIRQLSLLCIEILKNTYQLKSQFHERNIWREGRKSSYLRQKVEFEYSVGETKFHLVLK